MCLELQVLSDKYLKMKKLNPNIYTFAGDELKRIKYKTVEKNELTLNLQVVKVSNCYKVFFSVIRLGKLILIYLIEESNNYELVNEFENIYMDLQYMSIEMFIKKYCN